MKSCAFVNKNFQCGGGRRAATVVAHILTTANAIKTNNNCYLNFNMHHIYMYMNNNGVTQHTWRTMRSVRANRKTLPPTHTYTQLTYVCADLVIFAALVYTYCAIVLTVVELRVESVDDEYRKTKHACLQSYTIYIHTHSLQTRVVSLFSYVQLSI